MSGHVWSCIRYFYLLTGSCDCPEGPLFRNLFAMMLLIRLAPVRSVDVVAFFLLCFP